MFYKIIKEKGMQEILNPVNYQHPQFSNEEKVFAFLDEIKSSNAKTLCYGDYDVDGAMCAMVFKDSFKAMGCTNIDIYRYRERTHKVDHNAVHECIQGGYSFMVIGDTGSNDMDLVCRLCAYGVKIIILDHHNTIYNYDDFPSNVAIINTKIENSIVMQDKYALSAGALCFSVFYKYLQERCDIKLSHLFFYAFCSLYADCMNMINEVNRSIYWETLRLPMTSIPKHISCFMKKGSVFGRRYADFWFAPRLNALFRAEMFSILNTFLFDELDLEDLNSCVEVIEKIHSKSREMVDTLSDILEVVQLKNYVVCNLMASGQIARLDMNVLKNYTGLLANRLVDRYKKAAIVFCETATYYKGSVRDPEGRNQLQIFKQICEADGHNPAFGFTVNLMELDRFTDSLKRIDNYYALKSKKEGPFYVDYDVSIPNIQMINDMALYNDFAGEGTPYVYVRKELLGNMPQIYSTYYYKYQWGETCIQSNFPIDLGTTIIAKPVKRRETTLIV